MSQGAWILVVALVAATAFGLYRAARDGRFRGTREVHAATDASTPEQAPASVLDGSGLDSDLGDRATLLQFSSAFCAPCRVARRVLGEVAQVVPGVAHVEVDAEQHLDLVRRLGVLRTPTTLVLDAHGREVSRASGAPKRDEVIATLARVLPDLSEGGDHIAR
ncbi:MAG: TlpA family protein disulfide reductase [Nocardioidaceae bacterium]